MRNTTRFLAVLLAICIVISCVGCADKEADPNAADSAVTAPNDV